MKDIAGLLANGALTIFNHPEWYTNYLRGDNLVNANFGRRKGIPEPGLLFYDLQNDYFVGPVNTVGVELALMKPFGDNAGWDQGINYLYSTIRSANAGSINYKVADLENYILTMRSVHAAYAIARRAYATLRNFSAYDSTMPESLFQAMGLDYASFSENAADLRNRGNLLGLQITKLFPIKIPLIDRTRWLFSNFFADSDDAKATLYAFYPNYSTGKPFMITTNELGELEINGLQLSSVDGLAYKDFMDTISYMMNQVEDTPVYQIIAGDILKAFGPDAMYPAEIWAEDMPAPIVYDEYALSQIQNALVCNVDKANSDHQDLTVVRSVDVQSHLTTNTASLDLFDTPANVRPQIITTLNNCYINSPKDSVNQGELLSLTRFVVGFSDSLEAGSDDLSVTTCGTEIVTRVNAVMPFADDLNGLGLRLKKYSISGFSVYTVGDVTDLVTIAPFAWSCCDWAPRRFQLLQLYGQNSSTYSNYLTPSLWDFNNYALVIADQLRNYHSYANMSLLFVPTLIKQNKTELIRL